TEPSHAVPEPSTGALLLLAIILLSFCRFGWRLRTRL
ncbi:MAG: hypothetical protein CBB70_13120, partial [Planctomycetaceae bacterium TMED10]